MVGDEVTPRAPVGLKARGSRLWKEMTAPPAVWTPDRLTLIEELCRLVDRTEFLDKLLRGDETLWLRLRENSAGEISVTVDAAMVESRLTATAMKQIVAELRQARAEQKAVASPVTEGGDISNVTSLADRAKRRANSSG